MSSSSHSSSIRRRISNNPQNELDPETAPLLSLSNTQANQLNYPFNLQSIKYSILIALTLIFSFYICNTNLEPSKLSNSEFNPSSGFNTFRAQEHLKVITNLPHDVNSKENEKILEYLENSVKLLQAKTNRLKYILNNSTELVIHKDYKGSNFTTYYPTSNLVVKFKATNSIGKALLLSAHYDSRPLAPGATDNGIGVSVCLEILRSLIQHPPTNYDIVINFNNGEESGLLGSKGFKFNKWYKDTVAFINLEGAGSGGKALLFQSSSTTLNKALINGNSRHANVIGNDLFKLGLIQSSTDYQVYNGELGLMGVDIAFYRNRAIYHTLKDSFSNAPIESIHQMGTFIWQGIQNLGDRDIATGDHPIYFDLFWTTWAFNCTKIYLGIVLFFILEIGLIVSYLKFTNNRLSNYKKGVNYTFNGLKLNLIDLLITIILGYLSIRILAAINPAVVHSYPRLIFIFFLILIPTLKLSTQYIWFKYDNSSTKDSLISNWLSTLTVYNILIIIQLISHFKGLSALYFLLIQGYNLLLAFVIFIIFNLELDALTTLLPKLNTPTIKSNLILIQPYLSFLINFTIGTVSILNSSLTILMAGNQGAPTGSSDALPYLICLVFSIFIYLPLTPNLLLTSNKLKTITYMAILSSFLYIMLLVRFPYTNELPLPIYFRQQIELSSSNFEPIDSTVMLGINRKSGLLIDKLPSNPTKIEYGIPFKKTTMDYIYYSSELPKLPKFSPKLDIINNKHTNTNSTTSFKELEILFNPEETKICDLKFSKIINSLRIKQLTSNYKEVSSSLKELRLFRFNDEVGWKLKFSVNANEGEEFKLKAICYFNRIEEVNKLVNKLPNWITFHNREMGVISVNMEYNLNE